MPSTRRSPLPALLLAAALAGAALAGPAPLAAQDVPADARVRVLVRSNAGDDLRFRGRTLASDRDSLRLLREGFESPVAIAWPSVLRVELSDGVRTAGAAELLGTVAAVTGFGTLLGWSSWHTCRDPEDTTVLSCIVSPGRLGTAVRTGTWVGLGAGVLVALVNRRSERWRDLQVPVNRLHVRNTLGGTGIGLRFEF